jgi:hypothetical protein
MDKAVNTDKLTVHLLMRIFTMLKVNEIRMGKLYGPLDDEILKQAQSDALADFDAMLKKVEGDNV